MLLARRKVVADTAAVCQLVAGHVLARARIFEVLALVLAALVTLALEEGFGDIYSGGADKIITTV